jgi:hypothetical protein
MYVTPRGSMYLVVVSSAQELDEAKSEKIRNEDDNPCRIASISISIQHWQLFCHSQSTAPLLCSS